jgi:dienelactone hydrolase
LPVIKVSDDGLVASLYLPAVAGKRPAIIVLPGSGGGIGAVTIWGEPLASLGYAVLVLAYFAMDGLPRDLVEIPLEYFKRAIDWLRAHPDVDANRVGILGHSRGGEAALLVASACPEIRACIANVPSHVVWQGIHSEPGVAMSAWSRHGAGLPFLSVIRPRDGELWTDAFSRSLRDGENEAAAIPVEQINGPILFVTGTEDGVWPSSAMADLAVDRLRSRGFPHVIEHARYEGGGHVVLVPPYRIGPVDNPWADATYYRPAWLAQAPVMGGTADANRLARMDAWPRLVGFLSAHL